MCNVKEETNGKRPARKEEEKSFQKEEKSRRLKIDGIDEKKPPFSLSPFPSQNPNKPRHQPNFPKSPSSDFGEGELMQ